MSGQDTELMLDVGQANELKLAFRRAEWTNADVKRLCEGDTPALILPVIRGVAEVNYVIDLDAEPSLPKGGWHVEEHKKGGRLLWNPNKVRLYLSDDQQDGKIMQGHKLREELANKFVLNANVLDYLLAYPMLIPDEWKSKCVYFWGTIYRYSTGDLYVRCLLFWVSNSKWNDELRPLENCEWGDSHPAALFAS